jgi:hypothetical protein
MIFTPSQGYSPLPFVRFRFCAFMQVARLHIWSCSIWPLSQYKQQPCSRRTRSFRLLGQIREKKIGRAAQEPFCPCNHPFVEPLRGRGPVQTPPCTTRGMSGVVERVFCPERVSCKRSGFCQCCYRSLAPVPLSVFSLFSILLLGESSLSRWAVERQQLLEVTPRHKRRWSVACAHHLCCRESMASGENELD